MSNQARDVALWPFAPFRIHALKGRYRTNNGHRLESAPNVPVLNDPLQTTSLMTI